MVLLFGLNYLIKLKIQRIIKKKVIYLLTPKLVGKLNLLHPKVNACMDLMENAFIALMKIKNNIKKGNQ